MTSILLKHEWLRTRSMLGTVTGLAVLVSGLGILLSMTGWPLLAPLGLLGAGIAAMALVPLLQLALAADYWRSSYSRTGYFTHSLPLRGSQIYTAKLAWALIVSTAAAVITLGLLALFWVTLGAQAADPATALPSLGQMWAMLTDSVPAWMTIGAVLAVLFMYLMWPVLYYFAISIGHERVLSRLGAGGPVVTFVAVYLVLQVLILVGVFAFPLGIGAQDGQLAVVPFEFLAELTVGVNASSDVMPLGYLPVMAVVTALCLWRTVRSWNHKISLA